MDDAEFILFLEEFDGIVSQIRELWKKYPQLKIEEDAAECLTPSQREIYAKRVREAGVL